MAPKEYTTKEQILALADPDPEYASWKAANPIPNIPWNQPALLRAGYEEITKPTFDALSNPGMEFSIPMRDGYLSPTRVYKPQNPPASPKPLIVILFGGGFMMGDNRQMAPMAAVLSVQYGATVVLPSYRLSPEHPFPVAQNDTWDTLIWISEHAKSAPELAAVVDPSAGFVLCGASSGGNIAARSDSIG